jgi:hypothetical protein
MQEFLLPTPARAESIRPGLAATINVSWQDAAIRG